MEIYITTKICTSGLHNCRIQVDEIDVAWIIRKVEARQPKGTARKRVGANRNLQSAGDRAAHLVKVAIAELHQTSRDRAVGEVVNSLRIRASNADRIG